MKLTSDIAKEAEASFKKSLELFYDERYSDSEVLEKQFSDFCLSLSECVPIDMKNNAKHTQIKYSVSILFQKAGDEFFELLSEIKGLFHKSEYELIVIDNGANGVEDLILEKIPTAKYFEAPFNLGCSGGRNLSSLIASGKYIAFIDDDGFTKSDDIINLFTTIQRFNATAVRGKVVPKSDPSLSGGHYNLGDRIVFAPPSAEGISVWDNRLFKAFGGFSNLLSGHEGVELCSRMLKYVGLQSFLYTPDSVLVHDYALDALKRKEKKKKQKTNRNYLAFRGEGSKELIKNFNNIRNKDVITANLFNSSINSKFYIRKEERKTVSILTTVKNGVDFIDDYAFGLLNQTCDDFEIIVVDDHSTDGSVEKIKQQLKNAKIFSATTPGRAHALNDGLRASSGDVVLIHDIDDISFPNRVHNSLQVLGNREMDCCGFNYIASDTKRTPAFAFVPTEQDLVARAFFSMPTPFPTFAFVKEKFQLEFNPELEAGVDIDWISRTIAENPALKGVYIPLPCAYYRVHDKQISSLKRNEQDVSKLNSLLRIYESVCPIDKEELIGLAQAFSESKVDKKYHKIFNKMIEYIYQSNYDLACNISNIYSYYRHSPNFRKNIKFYKRLKA